jgi:hypothetical protein
VQKHSIVDRRQLASSIGASDRELGCPRCADIQEMAHGGGVKLPAIVVVSPSK